MMWLSMGNIVMWILGVVAFFWISSWLTFFKKDTYLGIVPIDVVEAIESVKN